MVRVLWGNMKGELLVFGVLDVYNYFFEEGRRYIVYVLFNDSFYDVKIIFW